MEESQPHGGDADTIQSILAEFSEAWEGGAPPSLESFISKVPPEHRPEVLEKLVHVDMAQRRKLGEQPTAAEYLKRFPTDRPTIVAATGSIQDTIAGTSDRSPPSLDGSDVDIQIGDRLGKYEIRSVLGVGGMGVVFGAYDTIIRREVAIKLLSRKHSTDDTALSRLLQEAQSAGAVHHPNIVGIYDVLEEDGAYFVVMEKVNGDNLSEVLQKSERGYLDWKLATKITIDCCDALTVAHRHGLIHRDIKPQNIMLTVESVAKLLDFGLAKSDQTGDTALTQEGTILGTPDFMSPEQCSASDVSALSDLYSLGATYYALLSGHAPFASQGSHLRVMFAHCNRPVPSITDKYPEVPAVCEAVITRAMAKKLEERYQSAEDFKHDLESILDGHTESISSTHAQSFQASSPKSLRGVFAAFAAALVIGIPALYFTWQSLAGSSGGDRVADADSTELPNASIPPFRGVTPTEIHLGTTTAYNGPSEELGRNMVVGMQTLFRHVNDSGGVHGRQIKLTFLDDRYDPERALANMKDLFQNRQVFSVIGNVGTPTAKVTARYASDNQHLFFAPFTGASLLREDPPDRYVFNFRASYEDETAAMVKYFVDIENIPPEKIAVFAQNDAYGDDGFKGVARAMRSYSIDPDDIVRVGYDRNQLEIDEAVQTILDEQNDIQAVVMVPTYKVAARFIKRVRESKPEMTFGSVSFVGSAALAEEFRELGAEFADGVVVTQVVPSFASNATGVIRYRDLLKKYFPAQEPDSVSMEGFIAASILVEAMERAGPELTTEALIDALHDIRDLDLGIGPIIRFSPSRHQASDRVWGIRLNEEAEFETVDLTH